MKKGLLIIFCTIALIPTWNFITGTIAYFTGNGQMLFVGLPVFEPLDRDYRVWERSSGCNASGLEPFTQGANNLAIKMWTTLLGYQKGTYHGIYPTAAEAFETIDASGKDASINNMKSAFGVVVDGKEIILKKHPYFELISMQHPVEAKAITINDELVIIRPRQEIVYLAEKRTGVIFAEYWRDLIKYY